MEHSLVSPERKATALLAINAVVSTSSKYEASVCFNLTRWLNLRSGQEILLSEVASRAWGSVVRGPRAGLQQPQKRHFVRCTARGWHLFVSRSLPLSLVLHVTVSSPQFLKQV